MAKFMGRPENVPLTQDVNIVIDSRPAAEKKTSNCAGCDVCTGCTLCIGCIGCAGCTKKVTAKKAAAEAQAAAEKAAALRASSSKIRHRCRNLIL